jgi:hypothetical protein
MANLSEILPYIIIIFFIHICNLYWIIFRFKVEPMLCSVRYLTAVKQPFFFSQFGFWGPRADTTVRRKPLALWSTSPPSPAAGLKRLPSASPSASHSASSSASLCSAGICWPASILRRGCCCQHAYIFSGSRTSTQTTDCQHYRCPRPSFSEW